MRLLERISDGNIRLAEQVPDDDPLEYAILSHTWGPHEVTFQDMLNGRAQAKQGGYSKIRFCAAQADRDRLSYFWVDTCCIDKSSSAELQEAISRMFSWYRNATKCYVHLEDVSGPLQDPSWASAFKQSRWFRRGWTLQELLAPKTVEFFSKDDAYLGNKSTLEHLIYDATDIPVAALRGEPLTEFHIDERFAWTQKRETAREEDMAYSLLGIFGVHIPLIYGEGRDNALRRLREEIGKAANSADATRLSSAAQRPQFVVPFGRNKNFVGRASVLRELVDRIRPTVDEDECQRTALEGLGGVGKTQLAIEAAYRVRDTNPNCSVFWVPAIDSAGVDAAYRTIGQALDIKGLDDGKADIQALVHAALARDDALPWVWIIDNADDYEALFGSNAVVKELPFNRRGSILVTTRTRTVVTSLGIPQHGLFRITGMSRVESAELLSKDLGEKQMPEEAITDALLDFLTDLPLAIKQASAYMMNTGMTVAKYLHHCRSGDQTVLKLLSKDFEDRWRYKNVSSPVATTWLISFEHIVRDAPVAAAYLKFMSVLVEKNIPRALLPTGDDKLEADEAIGILKAYAFITERPGEESYDMHRLVRLAMQNWLVEEGELRTTIGIAMTQLCWKYPDQWYNNKEEWMRYLPHAVKVLEFDDRCSDRSLKSALLLRVGHSYCLLGKDAEAENILRESYQLQKKLLGKTHPLTLSTLDDLAFNLMVQGRYEEAERLQWHVLKRRIFVIGVRNAKTIRSIKSLAQVLEYQEKYAKAEAQGRRALKLSLSTLGLEDHCTLECMNILGSVLYHQAEYKEAEALHRQALDVGRRIFGAEHPTTFPGTDGLALVCAAQGKYAEAEVLFRQGIELQSDVLGAEHPLTLSSTNKLAFVLLQQNKHEDAERLLRQMVNQLQKSTHAGHHGVVAGTRNCAYILTRLGRFDEAESLLRQAVEDQTKHFGAKHPNTLISLSSLAMTLGFQKKYKEAEALYRQTLGDQQRVLGRKHQETLFTKHGVVLLLSTQGNYYEAEALCRETLELRKEVLGADNPFTTSSMATLVRILRDEGRDEDAATLHKQMSDLLRKRQTRLGEEQVGDAVCSQLGGGNAELAETLAAFRGGVLKAGARKSRPAVVAVLDALRLGPLCRRKA